MLFRQFVDDDLGCASYLVGDEDVGEAVVVDPAYAIEQYLEEAARHDLRIVRVLETHTHADHVSGHGRFSLEQGLPVAIHALAEPEYPFEPIADGDEVVVGNVGLRVIHTPGHRPEHCCFAVTDRTRADEPWLLLTGDSLFVGDTARPDLAVEAHEGAEGLFHSLHRLLELNDGVEVYPGHVAGSLCGKSMSSKASTTIGFERRFNHALALATVEAFVAESAAVSAPRPANMERVVALNRGPFVGAPPPVGELAGPGDARVLDVRPSESFLAGHIRARSTCLLGRVLRDEDRVRRPGRGAARARVLGGRSPRQCVASSLSGSSARGYVVGGGRRRSSRSRWTSWTRSSPTTPSWSTCGRRTSARRRRCPGAGTFPIA